MAIQESEYFKTKAKNSELKHRHGYDVATSYAINQPSPEQLLKKIQQLEEKYSEFLTSDLNNPTRLLSPTP